MTSVYAQNQIQVTGVVVEEGLGELPGASVTVRGTTRGTVTDIDGRYSITAADNATLEFRFFGLETVLVPVNGRSVINVTMKSTSIAVDEVVVIGYGTQSARSVTSSISSISADALRDVPSTSVDQMLQGRAAGVSINTPSGAVGQAPTINIRGVGTINSGSTPLYIVDGIPILMIYASPCI